MAAAEKSAKGVLFLQVLERSHEGVQRDRARTISSIWSDVGDYGKVGIRLEDKIPESDIVGGGVMVGMRPRREQEKLPASSQVIEDGAERLSFDGLGDVSRSSSLPQVPNLHRDNKARSKRGRTA